MSRRTREQAQAAYDDVLRELSRTRDQAAGLYRSDKKAAREMVKRAQDEARRKVRELRADQRRTR